MRIYISGPITGHDDYKEKFAAAEERLRAAGYKVFNPAKLGEHLNNLTYEETLKVDLVILNSCDAIYMLPGWQQSRGANREYGYALAAGKKMMFEEGTNENT